MPDNATNRSKGQGVFSYFIPLDTKGFAAPMIILFTLFFLMLPVIYWFTLSKPNLNGSVKGSETTNINGDNGAALKVTSSEGTWDLYEYSCLSKEECLKDLYSGNKVSVISGGNTNSQFVAIQQNSVMDKNSYVKLFIKSGWGSTYRSFKTLNNQEELNKMISNITYNGVSYPVVIVPVADLSILKGFSFTDQ